MPRDLAKQYLQLGDKNLQVLRESIADVRTLTRQIVYPPSENGGGSTAAPSRNYVATGDLTIVGTTLYYTPRSGSEIWIYSGDDQTWNVFPITVMSLDITAYTTNKRYDVFYDYDSATDSPALSTLVWTSQTVRATALTTIDGVDVLSTNTALRYLGDFWYPATGIPIINNPTGNVSWGGTINGAVAGNFANLADVSGKVILDSGINVALYTDTKDPTGWVDPSAVTVTYDKTARTITLTGTLDYYWYGVKKTLTSPWTSSAHSASNGDYYLYSTDGITFAWSSSVWLFNYAMVAKAVYGASDKFALREPHGMMPWQVHKALHSKLGAWLDSGGLITAGTYAENTATDAATTPGWDAAVIFDEDNPTTIPAWAQGTYTTLRIGASSAPTYDTAATFPFRSSGSYVLINDPLTGAEAAGTNNQYVNVYTLLVPVTADAADSQKYRTLFLQPQATFGTLAAAQSENPYGLSLGTLRSTLPELVFNCRVTYVLAAGDLNTGKCRIATGGITYVVANGVSIMGGGGVPAHATSHISTGSDPIAAVVAGGASGLMLGTDKTKLDYLTLASATSITGGGTIALGGYTLTVPASGSVALLGTANIFTQDQTVQKANTRINLINTSATQYTVAGFDLHHSTASLGNNAGVLYNCIITDVAATKAAFSMLKIDYTGAYVSTLQTIDLNNSRFGWMATPESNFDIYGAASNPSASLYNGLFTVRSGTGIATSFGTFNGGDYSSWMQVSLNYAGIYYPMHIQPAGGGVIFNEDGAADGDFRAETDAYDGIFLDASNNSIVIMSNAAGKIGLWGAAAVAQSTGWAVSNVTTDKVFDADSTTINEIADVLGTLINTLKTYGILGA